MVIFNLKNILCFGDSLIEGFPFGKECSWCAEAESGGDFRLLNYGVCGECCDDILWRLEHIRLPNQVDGLIFLGGANDVLCGRSAQESVGNIDRAAAWAQEKGWPFAVVLPLISDDLLLNAGLKKLTDLLKQRDYFFIDLQPGISYGADELARAYVDGVHPTAATYRKMGEVARPQIEKWLTKI